MTREKFGALCRDCCRQSGLSECLFADADVGFIDTSAECDGSRGIAFSKRKMMVNFDGTVKNVAYCKIRSVQIISSMEDAFADELEISGEHSRLRISDYSIDKLKLKQLIEGLIEGIEDNAPVEETAETVAEKVPKTVDETVENVEEKAADTPTETVEITAEKVAENVEEIPENVAETVEDLSAENVGETPETVEETVENVEEKVPETVAKAVENFDEPFFPQESEIPVIEEQPASEPFPVGEIEWLNGAVKTEEKVVTEEKIEWLSGMSDNEQPPEIPENSTDSETADREFIEQMSHEETLDFLSKALNEINDEPAPETLPEIVVKPDTNALLVSNFPQNLPEEKAPPKKDGLSKEPVWGDIYIKASRSLRELCESGKLSMNVIENELREKLLDSANAFAKIIADEQKVPKTLIPKIAELKNAAANFDEYFAYGEDVGVRVMFFMLYQMLSYADRIAENPDTKEPLNDFFRRFGTAGITLSMLDVRG
ncbi:MAG: hypothetical protein ACI4JZ_09115 [Oscillospiraceae bacterium]